MKILTLLLLVLAVFSQAVLSQKVDRLASSAIETAKEDASPVVSQAF